MAGQRAIWSGLVSFGMVTVPVKLYTATTEQRVRFHQINSKTGHRINMKRVDSQTGAEVPWEDIVNGYEESDGHYVTVTSDELASLLPERTKQIKIEQFVTLAEIDPLLYDKSYYLAPDKGGSQAYALLSTAMAKAKRIGVGRFMLRNREHIVALRPYNGGLVVSTLLFNAEINDLNALIGELPKPSKAELDMAKRVVDAYMAHFDHTQYVDEYRCEVLKLIEAKASGEVIEVQETTPAVSQGDLLSALEATLQEVRRGTV